jgi:hypothetical protein
MLAVRLGVGVAVPVAVAAGLVQVGEGVCVTPEVGVKVATPPGVFVALGLGVGVAVPAGVLEGVTEPTNRSPKSKTTTLPPATGKSTVSGVVETVPGGLLSVKR